MKKMVTRPAATIRLRMESLVVRVNCLKLFKSACTSQVSPLTAQLGRRVEHNPCAVVSADSKSQPSLATLNCNGNRPLIARPVLQAEKQYSYSQYDERIPVKKGIQAPHTSVQLFGKSRFQQPVVGTKDLKACRRLCRSRLLMESALRYALIPRVFREEIASTTSFVVTMAPA